MFEMSLPNHALFIDEPLYFYTGYKYSGAMVKTKFPDTAYSVTSAQTVPPYYSLETLHDTPKRNTNFVPIQTKVDEKSTKTKEVIA